MSTLTIGSKTLTIGSSELTIGAASVTFKIGFETEVDSQSNGLANLRGHTCNRDLFYLTTNATSVIKKFGARVELDDAVGTISWGVYKVDPSSIPATPTPTDLIHQTATVALLGDDTIHTVTLDEDVPLPEEGVTYCVVMIIESLASNIKMYGETASTDFTNNILRTDTLGSATLPDPWSGSNTINGNKASIWADGVLSTGTASPTLTTPYADVTAKVGDSYGPVDYTTNTSGADTYKLSGFPDGIDSSDPRAVQGVFTRYGKSYPGIDASNEFGTAPQNHFTFDITQEFTVATSDVLDTSIETPQDIVKPDGHSIFGSGFAHNFVGVSYFSDSDGLIPVDQTAVGGSSVVTVATVEAPLEQDAIPTEGATGKRWSFAGNPTKGQITFTSITGGAFARVTTRQNKT